MLPPKEIISWREPMMFLTMRQMRGEKPWTSTQQAWWGHWVRAGDQWWGWSWWLRPIWWHSPSLPQDSIVWRWLNPAPSPGTPTACSCPWPHTACCSPASPWSWSSPGHWDGLHSQVWWSVSCWLCSWWSECFLWWRCCSDALKQNKYCFKI